MGLSLSRLFGSRRSVERPTTRRETYFRPALETLEGRIVLSAPALIAPPALAPALAPAPMAAPSGVTPQQLITQAMNLNLTGITNQAGQLTATGTAFGIPFTSPITLTSNADCSILNLELGPINLNLLGLQVTTSPICLTITAIPGSGNLLGNLLCDVAGLLNSGTPLSNIFNTLSQAGNLSTFTSGVTNLLNGALGNVLATTSTTSPPSGGHHQPGATCPILDLSLGPVDLTLLGLNVHLDNCTGGPVTVDVTAIPGPGNLLGNLLCNVANLLNQPNPTSAISALLTTIENDIQRLL